MITIIDVSQEIVAIDILEALKSSCEESLQAGSATVLSMETRLIKCCKTWSPYGQKYRKHVLATMSQRAYYSSPGVDCKNLL